MFGIGRSSTTGGKVGKAAPKGTPPGRGIPVTTPTTGTRAVGRKPSKPRQSGS